MKELKSIGKVLSSEELNEQIEEIHEMKLSRVDKQKALIELGLKAEDLRIIHNGMYFNPFAPIRVVTKRGVSFTYGVEIECFAPHIRLAETSIANGVRMALESYNHRDNKTYYKLVPDASVRSSNVDEDRNSIECVSPILKGASGFKSLKLACQTLNDAGASVNKTCGLHVHIGADKLTQVQIVNVYKNYQRLESVIDSFMPASRRNNAYAIALRGLNFSECTTNEDILSVMGYSRYYKVNACALSRHNTIEFRQHGGTTNFEKIQKWVKFLIKLVEWSMENVFTSDVESVDDIPFLNTAEKRYFKARIASLNA